MFKATISILLYRVANIFLFFVFIVYLSKNRLINLSFLNTESSNPNKNEQIYKNKRQFLDKLAYHFISCIIYRL
jgi:hypothetical protein